MIRRKETGEGRLMVKLVWPILMGAILLCHAPSVLAQGLGASRQLSFVKMLASHSMAGQPVARVLQVLGTAAWTDKGDSGRLVGYGFRGGLVPEGVTVHVWLDEKARKVDEIEVSGLSLNAEDVRNALGGPFKEQRYSFDECLGDGESSPVFEDPKGTLVYLVDAKRNRYFQVSTGIIESMLLRSSALGSRKSRCQ